MAIKANVSEGDEASVFPKLRIYPTGAIILFTTEAAGTCVRADSVTPMGHYAHAWGQRGTLVDFNGSITLSNGG